MKRKIFFIILAVCLMAVATIYAGQGYFMKCRAKPDKDPRTNEPLKPCEYESRVSFGGGKFFEQATGYCRVCKKFVYLNWTRKDIPDHAGQEPNLKKSPRPEPLGQVWDSRTGRVMTVYTCPTCKGPFLEIEKVEDLKFCPACNLPHFAIDKTKSMLMID